LTCPCEGLRGLELLQCFAPPQGEYETSIKISDNMIIVINDKGIFIRRIVTDDFLPFITTIDRRITRIETLQAYRLDIKELLCYNLENLIEASKHGSSKAKQLLDNCWKLAEKIKSECEGKYGAATSHTPSQ
jgi:hypothetical protein